MSNSNDDCRVFSTNSTVVSKSVSEETQLALSNNQLLYSKIGLFVGVTCIFIGAILLWLGIDSTTEWSFSTLNSESKLTSAAPGTVFLIVGFFIIWVTKYKFKVVGE